MSPQGSPDSENGLADISRAEVESQLERILASREFAGSASLQDFLSYSVNEGLAGRTDGLKEHSIAVSVFGRKESFDGRDDTIVRVQAHRLRSKLNDYYSRTGSADDIYISLPRGSYSPQFKRRAPLAAPTAAEEPLGEAAAQTSAGSPSSSYSAVKLAIFGGLLLAAGMAIGARTPAPVSSTPSDSLLMLTPSPVRQLWAPLLNSQAASTLIVFNPTVFLSNSNALVRYGGPYSGPTDTPIASESQRLAPFVEPSALQALGPLVFNHSWGAVGHTAQVFHLTKLFAAAGRETSLRSSKRLDRSDVGDRNVIILDSEVLRSSWSQPPYTFEPPVDKYEKVRPQPRFNRIRNHFPQEGEPEYYDVEHRRDTSAREFDYGLFAILPGVTPSSRIAVCAGLTTFGGWGVAQFVASEAGAAAILEQLGAPAPEYFQVLLKVGIDLDSINSVEIVDAKPVR